MLKTRAGAIVGTTPTRPQTPQAPRAPPRLLEFAELKSIHGVPYTRQYLSILEKRGEFPQRINLAGKVRWLQSEVEDWIAQQAAECRGSGVMRGFEREMA